MKIKSLKIFDHKPIKMLEMDNLGNTIIIAGANGAGKTRLKEAIISSFQKTPEMDIIIEATRPEEQDEKYFNGNILQLEKGKSNPILSSYISSRKYGSGRYVGSVVQIDSTRTIQALNFKAVNWLGGDPDDTESPSNYYFTPFSNRWQDFINYIHQKVAARDKKLADELKKRPDEGREIMNENPDPFNKYKVLFAEILPGKTLLDIDPAKPSEFRYKDEQQQLLLFNSLSSGEQEVIKVLFDVARKEIRHSIIIVDEPELHLHPTLTFKLVEALKAIGDHTNQFIFLTHSADLISTYYSTGNVFFIDSNQSGSNQAHRLSMLNHSHSEVVKLIGQNLGLFAVGKKLVFIEGTNSSIDRLTYHKIAQKINQEIKVIPVGSVLNLMTLNSLEEQIRNSIFGVNIYMLRDRDGLRQDQIIELEKNGKVKILKRRHIENYFLEPDLLFKVADQFYLTKSNKNLSVNYIEEELLRIAKETLNFNIYKNIKDFLTINFQLKDPKIQNLHIKSSDIIKSELISNIENNLEDLTTNLTTQKLNDWYTDEDSNLNLMLNNGDWKYNFQGKIIFSKICSETLKTDPLRLREAYIDLALQENHSSISDLLNIFQEIK